MAEVTEAMARAMCIDGGFDPDEMMPNDGPRWRYYVPSARAALAAMLEAVGEPTEAMLLDGVDAWHNAEPCLLDEQLALVWKAMLAASPLYSLAALREALPPPPQD